MRALFLIPNSESPTLEGNFSKAFKEFVSLCLQKEPQARPSAKELSKHKWIKGAKKSSALMEVVKEHEAWMLEHQNETEELDEEKFYRYIVLS